MTRRSGQIRSRGPEKWCVTAFVGRDANGKRQYTSKVVKGGKKKAEAALRKMLGDKDANRLGTPDRRPLGEFLNMWLHDAVSVQVRPSTLANYTREVTTYIKPSLGAIRLDKLSTLQVQAWVRGLSDRGLAPRTVRAAAGVLNAALRYAVRLRLLPYNPMADVVLPRKQRRELRIPGQAARAALLTELRANKHWPLWCLLITAGLRPSEALGLKWSDLSPDGVLTVQRTLTRLRGSWSLMDTKTASGRRRVPLPAETVEVLREHHERQAEAAERYAGFAEDLGFIFANGLGQPLDWNSVRQCHFAPALRRAVMTCTVCGLRLREPRPGTLEHAGPVLVGGHATGGDHAAAPFKELEGLTPYSLRHLHASLLLAGGVSLRTVSERLGHTDPGFTLSTYTHLVPGSSDAAALVIGEAVFGKGKKPGR